MDKRIFLIFIIILSFCVRALYYYAQPDLSTDHLSQMAMAQNFLDGHGFSFKFIDVHSQIFYKTHIQWPPLYPLLLSAISLITANTLIASLIIQIAVLLFLIIIWKKIFNLLNKFVSEEAYFYFISLLIISTSILNNINTVLVFALLLLSLSLFFTFAYMFDYKSKRTNIIFSALFASLLFWTHYSYFFVASFYPAVVLFIIFLITKDKNHLYAAVQSFIISSVFTSGVLLYNYLTTGYINYMDNPHIWDAGFFPEHLLLTDPFFLNAFFKSSYLIDYLFGNYQHIFLALIFQLVSLIIFTSIVALLMRLKNNKTIEFDKSSQLFIPFIVIIVSTTSFLLYFTLRYHEIPRPGWTHIGDPRYMSPVYLSIIAIFIMLVFVRADYVNRKFIKAIKSIMIVLIFSNLGINIYITAKEWGNYTYKDNNFKNFQGELQALFDNIKLESSRGKQPVFIDNELTVRSFRISQYAGAAVINVNKVKEIEQFSSYMVFFFILPEEKYYRDVDYQLMNWGNRFNLNSCGKVYNNLSLFKIKN